ncbi:MAG: hypothetical protein JW716_02450 [Candidatus Aenigmarchaeota archaeon]|nr:hypothetical protein [Candidatus Aenigmarchaeota archaeon]
MIKGKPPGRYSENELLQVASEHCMVSPGNILLIGGGSVLPQISGFKMLRPRSEDLDFVANSEGVEALRANASLLDSGTIGRASGEFLFRDCYNGVHVAVFPEGVRGFRFSEPDYLNSRQVETESGKVYAVGPELNTALKIRRGSSKKDNPHIYAKDAMDFATMVTGANIRETPFDVKRWEEYMKRGVCRDCLLGEKAGCIEALAYGATNLKTEFRKHVYDKIEQCRNCAYHFCRK